MRMNKPYPCSDCCDEDPPCGDCEDNISPQSIDLVIDSVANDACTGATFLNATYTLPSTSDCTWGAEVDINGDGVQINDTCVDAVGITILVTLASLKLTVSFTVHDGGIENEVIIYEVAAIAEEQCCAWSSHNIPFVSATGGDATLGNDWSSSTASITADDDCLPCSLCTADAPYEFSVVLSNNFTSSSCSTAECTPHSGTYIVQKTAYYGKGCSWSKDAAITGRHTGWGNIVVGHQCHDAEKVGASLIINDSGLMSFSLETHWGAFHNNYNWRIDADPYDCMNLSSFELTWYQGATFRNTALFPGVGCDASAVTCKVTTV
jgi:hypothetical protein